MSIIISRKGKDAEKLEAKPIPQEDYLQRYIYANPEALPMEEIGEDIRLLVLAREFDTQSGPIDAIAIDQDGEIYIIETKLYSNPDKRKVLAQVLDYGASLWRGFGGADAVVSALRDATRSSLGKPLGDVLQEHYGLDESGSREVIQSLGQNIENGAFRFVILMDRLDDRLKDLISFVNENSRFTLYGVELEFYEFKEYEIVIPKLYGAEARKEVGSSSPRRTWNEDEFFEEISSNLDADHAAAVRRIYEFARNSADSISWGTGLTVGTFNAKYQKVASPSVFTVYTDGKLALNFGWLGESESGRRAIEQLAGSVRDELNLALPPDYEKLYPKWNSEEWCPEVDEWIRVLSEVLTAD
ncbi:MAG: hypothetical protein ACE5M4_11755 [Anaerolineales bacterium]